MSSISSPASQNTPPPVFVDNLGDGRFRVMNPEDMDGDGVKDGEALNSAEGKVVNAQGLNQLFQDRGINQISAQGNAIVGMGGLPVTAANNSAFTDFNFAPLPELGSAGSSPPPVTVGPKSEWLGNIDDAALMWVAMRTMAELAQRDITDQRELRDEMQQGKLEAQQASIDAQRAKIEAERDAAMFTMVTSITAAVVGGVVGSTNGQAWGQGLTGAINSVGQYVNKAHGPQAEADMKELENQRWQMMMTMFEQVEDDAKAGIDAAREEFKLALRIISEHEERNSQVIQRSTSA